MIINGGSRRNARFFAKHLAKGEENERITVCDIRNLAALTIADAFREMAAIAMGTRCENYFYHANINPHSDEPLMPAQWQRAFDLLEDNLGLANHARFVVEHAKKGRIHRHSIWLRIDVTRMRAVEMTDDYEKHQATARQLEGEFGLKPGKSVLGPDRQKGERPARCPKPWETFRGHQSGLDPRAMTQDVTLLYRSSEDGNAFAVRLQENGFRLVRGDGRDFCIVDAQGHKHSLARRLTGIRADELAKFMKNVHPQT